jgi:glycosyltransferase involved in cell wall biosynthesis
MRNVVISSPFATQSGYGCHAREVITNILENQPDDWDVRLISMPWGHTPLTETPIHWNKLLIGLPLQTQPDIFIQITVPNEFQPIGRYNIGITAATEADQCPPEWIDSINKMQLIVVPSEFTKSTITAAAIEHNLQITTEIRVIPEYFRKEVFNNENIEIELKELDEIPESFAFLSVGHWLQGAVGEDRKNISGLVYTFLDTFKNQKISPALILKTSGATYSHVDRWEIEKKINEIRKMFIGNLKLPNIYLLHGELTDVEMNSLYNHSKVKAMVSFTKGEGFGRPLLEFATTGKPIIAPHYSGQCDFLVAEFICALPGQLTNIHSTAANQFLPETRKWFTVNYKYAADMLKEVHKNYKKWLIPAKRQRYFVNNNFSKDGISNRYVELIAFVVHETNKTIPKLQSIKLPKLQPTSLPKLQKIE